MPVCILGMHRSGTSMVTRLLHGCGLALGEPDALLGPDPAGVDNPKGYWEHLEFTAVNDALLASRDAAWDLPPLPGQPWTDGGAPAALGARADALVERFSGREPWGWKDPRTCLTLGFWRARVPDLRLVLCLRNPWEAALSIGRGEVNRDLDLARALDLWLDYHRALLAEVEPEELVVTHYDSYAYDAPGELRRVLDALGLPASEAAVEEAAGTVEAGLHRIRYGTLELSEGDVPRTVHELYAALAAHAGPVRDRMLADRAFREAEGARRLRHLQLQYQAERTRALELSLEVTRLRERLAALEPGPGDAALPAPAATPTAEPPDPPDGP